MLVGFQDDPSLRWRDDRPRVFDIGREGQCGNRADDRLLVAHRREAPGERDQPVRSRYHFDDLDEFVRNARLHGMEVMLTIWGTPAWANGGKGQNYAPTRIDRPAELRARRSRSRYSGRFPGYPFVRFYTVWNESNLGQFLSPQYVAKASPPRRGSTRSSTARRMPGSRRETRARSSASARPPREGATSLSAGRAPRRRSRRASSPSCSPSSGRRSSSTPGRTTPTRPRRAQPPTQKVRWPNVNLTSCRGSSSRWSSWFHRVVPIWITEYGYETKPGEPKRRQHRAAGRLHAPGYGHRRQRPARDDVHLVHRPRRPDERVAERVTEQGRIARSPPTASTPRWPTSTTAVTRRSR